MEKFATNKIQYIPREGEQNRREHTVMDGCPDGSYGHSPRIQSHECGFRHSEGIDCDTAAEFYYADERLLGYAR